MSAILSPIGGAAAQFFNNLGVILAGGKLYTYAAGTLSALATYTDSTAATSNSNPVILDSTGRPPNEIWLQNSTGYKFVLTDANNVTIGTWDNIQGINSASSTPPEWLSNGLAVTYVSASQFSVSGNLTGLFSVNRRIQYGLSSGTYYGFVSASSYDGSTTTTVTVGVDSTALNNTLYYVNQSFLSSVNPSIPQNYTQDLGGTTAQRPTTTSNPPAALNMPYLDYTLGNGTTTAVPIWCTNITGSTVTWSNAAGMPV